jgi:dipeptidyl aminopeptidase/acylaminoacyl peptidase
MRKWFAAGLISAGIILLGLSFWFWQKREGVVSPLASSLKKSLPGGNKYAPYTFEALSAQEFRPGKISLASLTKKEKNFDTYVFTYQSDGKTISGMANIPMGEGPFPVIVLLRGYANRETYHIGLGTERSANFLAEQGFLTLAPDFLGYGWSDWEDQDILLARFYRPVEVLSLLAGIDSLPQADESRIGLWGHSNGGQIALSILEITGKPYPTSLWAPVSLGFPESVTVYLGTQEEVGNPVKEKVEEFLKDNDPKKFSIAAHFAQIKAPFIVHQGLVDELIKTEWTRDLVDQLKSGGLMVETYYYRGENHNFNRYESTGDLLRQRDWEFFRKYLGE